MSDLERPIGGGIENILAETQRINSLRRYLEQARLRARQTGRSVLEVVRSDLERVAGGRFHQLFAPTRYEEIASRLKVVTSYLFPVPDVGNLIYYPQRRMAISPLLSEGTTVNLSPLLGLLLETFMKNPAAVYTTAELASLIQETLGQAPTLNESNRMQVLIHRLRGSLGEVVLEKRSGRYFGHRLIHTTPAGYTLVPNPHMLNLSR